MATIYTGKDYQFGFFPTTDFDGIAPGSCAWRKLRLKNIQIHPTVDLVQRDVSVGHRQEEDDDYAVLVKGVEQTVTFDPYDVERERLSEWLLLAMQQVTEAAASPYSKIFTPHATNPDFAADSGRLTYLIAAHPTAESKSFLACGAMLKELTLSINPSNMGRRLLLGGTFLCRRILQNFSYQGTFSAGSISNAPWVFDDIYGNGGVSLGAIRSCFMGLI